MNVVGSPPAARVEAVERALGLLQCFRRPGEALSLAEPGSAGDDRITGRVTAEEFEGPSYHLFRQGPAAVPIRTSLVNQGRAQAAGIGAEVTVRFDPMKAVALPAGDLAEEE